jgi:hypothetical protein
MTAVSTQSALPEIILSISFAVSLTWARTAGRSTPHTVRRLRDKVDFIFVVLSASLSFIGYAASREAIVKYGIYKTNAAFITSPIQPYKSDMDHGNVVAEAIIQWDLQALQGFYWGDRQPFRSRLTIRGYYFACILPKGANCGLIIT